MKFRNSRAGTVAPSVRRTNAGLTLLVALVGLNCLAGNAAQGQDFVPFVIPARIDAQETIWMADWEPITTDSQRLSADEHFRHNGKPNRHGQYDTGQAVAQLALQATDLGLFVHQMAGFDAEAARERFHVPANHTPMAAIAVGHPGEASDLPEALAEKERGPRERVPVSTFAFAGKWGEPASLA